MEQPKHSYLLDAATAAKEVATLTALCLMQTGGDPDAAITMLDSLAPTRTPTPGDRTRRSANR